MYKVDSCVCDYAVYEDGVLIPELILNSRKNAEKVCEIMNLDAEHKVYEEQSACIPAVNPPKSGRLIWSDDTDKVYGLKEDFKNVEDFIAQVTEDYRGMRGIDCIMGDVETKYFISTCEGIAAESMTPIDATDISMNMYYTADVEEAEGKE